jgi:hypothetical protein
VLHRSRARGDDHARSDWDFGYRETSRVDRLALSAELRTELGADRVDLANLDHAGGVLRYRAAREGVAVHAAAPGAFERFWTEAVRFWWVEEAVLRPAYDAVLDRLER